MRALVIGIATVSIALISLSGFAQTHEEYEVVLLPILTRGERSGAHGSVWVTDFTVYNGLPSEISGSEIWPLVDCVSIPCFDTFIPPHTAEKPPSPRTSPGELPGVILKLRRDVADQIALALRVRDISREALTAGTEIPVIREKDLSRSVVLLDIPLDGRFRQHLRIYDPLPHEHCVDVSIRYFDMESSLTLRTEERTLMRRDCRQELGNTVPNAVELDDLASRATGSGGSIGVEISAKRDTDRIWAFVSVTNNETQHVTLVTPQ